MPLFEFSCATCQHVSTLYLANSHDPRTSPQACERCAGEASYVGLSQCLQRSAKPMGATLRGGQFVPGNFHAAPRRSGRAKVF